MSVPAGATAASATTFRHAPALDGLRGLAVAAVVVYHVWPGALPGGFIGVDVFFVLSGFLLSSLLVREAESNGRIAVGRFFVRRVRRLLPATLLVLTALALYGFVWAEAGELQRLREHTIGALTYTINWLFIVDGTTYTDVVLGASPLRHMWSLAIEEQFYIVLAVAMAALVWFHRNDRSRLRHRLAFGAATLAAVSASWALLLEASNADLARLYFGSDTRAQAMLVGVALGAMAGGRLLGNEGALVDAAGAAALAIAGFGLLAVFSAYGAEDARWMFRGGFTVVALASAAAIAASLSSPTLGRVLSLAPLAGLGAISYGVYLWHWPVLVILDADRLGVDGTSLAALQIAITLAVSIVSYVLVERPIRHGAIGRTFGRWSVAIAPLAVVAVGAVAVVATVPDTESGDDVVAGEVIGQTADDPALADDALLQVAAVGDSVMHTLIGGDLEAALQAVPWNQEQSSFDTGTVAVTTIARPACSFLPGLVAFESPGGYETADLSPPCRDWRGDLLTSVTRPVPVEVVAVMPSNDLEDREVDGSIVPFGTDEWEDLLFDWLGEITEIARAGNARVLLVAPAPRIDPNWSTPQGEREARVAQIFDIHAVANDDVVAIDLGAFVGDDVDTRYDGLHYTDDGAARVAEWLTPQLQAIAAV